jgi:hypothetical protein
MMRSLSDAKPAACISPNPKDNEQAKLWFNCVEEMVFSDHNLNGEALCTYDATAPHLGVNKSKIQAVQAAYNVCLYQNWEGTDASKRRIRRYRYSTVVCVRTLQLRSLDNNGHYLPTVKAARDISIKSAKHPESDFDLRSNVDWRMFAAREECIR